MTPKITKREKIKNWAIGIFAFIILVGVLWLGMYILTIDGGDAENRFLVVNVTDGDTFQIATGEVVRLICVDTPEKEESGYNEAKEFLEELILNKLVRLELDENVRPKETIDKYGRILRYAYVYDDFGIEIFINKEIVEKKYGKVFPYGNSTSKCEEIGKT